MRLHALSTLCDAGCTEWPVCRLSHYEGIRVPLYFINMICVCGMETAPAGLSNQQNMHVTCDVVADAWEAAHRIPRGRDVDSCRSVLQDLLCTWRRQPPPSRRRNECLLPQQRNRRLSLVVRWFEASPDCLLWKAKGSEGEGYGRPSTYHAVDTVNHLQLPTTRL